MWYQWWMSKKKRDKWKHGSSKTAPGKCFTSKANVCVWLMNFGLSRSLAGTLAKHGSLPQWESINRSRETWQTFKGLERVTQSMTFFFCLPPLGSLKCLNADDWLSTQLDVFILTECVRLSSASSESLHPESAIKVYKIAVTPWWLSEQQTKANWTLQEETL